MFSWYAVLVPLIGIIISIIALFLHKKKSAIKISAQFSYESDTIKEQPNESIKKKENDLMSWNEWQTIESASSYNGPAVYELRMTNCNRNPISIPRFLSSDYRGLLSIGETGSMDKRRKQFINAIAKCSGHSEGNLFYYLLRYSPIMERFPDYQLEYRFYPKVDKSSAKIEEAKLIKTYICEFGEVPPLNSAIPNRYGCWDLKKTAK